MGSTPEVALDSLYFDLTVRADQGPVLWGASNGTGPLLAYNFSTTTGPSSTSSSQLTTLSSVPALTIAPSSLQSMSILSSSHVQVGTTPSSGKTIMTWLSNRVVNYIVFVPTDDYPVITSIGRCTLTKSINSCTAPFKSSSVVEYRRRDRNHHRLCGRRSISRSMALDVPQNAET